MITDLRDPLDDAMQQLLTWRNHYSKTDYPEKVVLNIFFKKYTIEFMFKEILGCFETNLFGKPKVKWTEKEEGFLKLKLIYNSVSTSLIQPVLLNLLKDKKKYVGNTTFEFFQPFIAEAKKGNKDKLEEIEFAYLDNYLKDECILRWGALGGTSLTKIDSIGTFSGLLINIPEIITYARIEQILGQFCSKIFLESNYRQLS